jgi:hypothetical protein
VDVRVRKPNDANVTDVLEKARKRFEEQLLEKQKKDMQISEDIKRFESESKDYYNEIEG